MVACYTATDVLIRGARLLHIENSGTGLLIPVALVLILLAAGCGRLRPVEQAPAPEDLQAAPNRSTTSPSAAFREFEHATTADQNAWRGKWESEMFRGLTLRIEDGAVVGEYADGAGHLKGELYGDSIDFEFWKGAASFNDAPLDQRGIGSGKLNPADGTAKGTYTTDTFEEGRWSMTRIEEG